MLEFPKIYPDAEDRWLEKNYRSSEEIVRLADCLISHNTNRVPMKLSAMFQTGFKAIHIPYFKMSHLPELIMEILEKGYKYQIMRGCGPGCSWGRNDSSYGKA